MTTLEANHAYRILATQVLNYARAAAEEGQVFGDRVPLALVVDMADLEWQATLVDLNRMGLIELHRADLTWAWVEKFGEDVMRRSELKHPVSSWHAVAVPGWQR
jgi:hypothetical protein